MRSVSVIFALWLSGVAVADLWRPANPYQSRLTKLAPLPEQILAPTIPALLPSQANSSPRALELDRKPLLGRSDYPIVAEARQSEERAQRAVSNLRGRDPGFALQMVGQIQPAAWKEIYAGRAAIDAPDPIDFNGPSQQPITEEIDWLASRNVAIPEPASGVSLLILAGLLGGFRRHS